MNQIFKKVRVFPNYSIGHYIEWDLNPIFRAPLPFNFYLEASEVEDFSTLIFSTSVGDTYSAVDTSGLKQNLTQNYIYRVRLVTGDGTSYCSFSVILGNISAGIKKYAQGCEVMRLEQVAQRFSGEPAFFLKRKTYGDIDTGAVDPVSGSPIDDNTTSYGTGIIGGYYSPIPIAIRNPTKNELRALNTQGFGVDEVYERTSRLIGFPKISSEDLIATQRDNIFYNVMNVHSTYIPGTGMCVIQSLGLRSIPVTDTVYNITLPSYGLLSS